MIAAWYILGSFFTWLLGWSDPLTFDVSCSRSCAAGTNAGLSGALTRGCRWTFGRIWRPACKAANAHANQQQHINSMVLCCQHARKGIRD